MSAGSWTHCICGDCWIEKRLADRDGVIKDPEGYTYVRLPVRVLGVQIEPCCTCGRDTKLGAYVRGDPKLVHP